MTEPYEFEDDFGDIVYAVGSATRPGIVVASAPRGCYIPSDRLEEVIAGLRDVNRAAVAEHEKRKEDGRG